MDIRQLETDLKAKQVEASTLMETTARACQDAIVTPATATTPAVTGRTMTAEEKGAIQAILDQGKAIKARIDHAQGDATMNAEIARLTDGLQAHREAPNTGWTPAPVLKSIGQQVVDSPEYRAFIKGGGHRNGQMFSGVELQATLMDTTSGSGGPLITPDYQPGIVPILFRRLTVADLIASGTTTSNAIIYMKELAATNAAAATTEGASKPESALTFVQATDPVQKIATFVPITEELMEDFPAMASYLDARLRLFIKLAEEDQLLNGTGTPPQIKGIMNRAGLSTAQARGADTNMDAVLKAMIQLASVVFVAPDGFVMNPINWQTVQLAKNANGNYLGFGPWVPPQPSTLWGVPGVITPAIASGTALVGAFSTMAQFFRKGGLRVETSNSHSTYFVENKIAVRAEERGALCVYREAAFQKVTGLA